MARIALSSFSAGMLVKTSLINFSLASFVGDEGVAVANVPTSLCAIIGTFTCGCTNAYSAMASLYYGEEDKEASIDIFNIALRTGLISTSVLTVVLSVYHTLLAGIFFKTDTGIFAIGQSMFILGFLFVPLNIIFNLLINSYRMQNRMTFVNVMSFVETAMIGVFALVAAPRLKSSGVWLANTWSDLLCLAVILIWVSVRNRKPTFRTADLLILPDDFGAGRDEFVEYEVISINDVSRISQASIEFCKSKGISSRLSYHAGLCIEEISMNILQHGENDGKSHHVSVRLVCKDKLTIRIQDDCRKFDPRERMDMYDSKTLEKNIGLRLVSKAASSVDYYNNAGINTLILNLNA